MRREITIVMGIAFMISSCAGPNPNPGERTADRDLIYGDATEWVRMSTEWSEKGYPWAQLRAGIAYGYGMGVSKDLDRSISYLEEVAKIYTTNPDGWQSGNLLTSGELGYFNSNSDALLAHYHIANILQDSDRQKAFGHISFVHKNISNGQPLFFCCEFAGGRVIEFQKIETLYNKLKE